MRRTYDQGAHFPGGKWKEDVVKCAALKTMCDLAQLLVRFNNAMRKLEVDLRKLIAEEMSAGS
jgi:hypothetical protein